MPCRHGTPAEDLSAFLSSRLFVFRERAVKCTWFKSRSGFESFCALMFSGNTENGKKGIRGISHSDDHSLCFLSITLLPTQLPTRGEIDLLLPSRIASAWISLSAGSRGIRKSICARVWDWQMDEGVSFPVKQHSQTMSWKTRDPVYLGGTSLTAGQESRLPTSLRYLSPPSVQCLAARLVWEDNAAQTT